MLFIFVLMHSDFCNCRLSWWKGCAEYFPTHLIKTAALDPDGRYIFVVAPHGVVTMYAWPVFDTNATDFAAQYPGAGRLQLCMMNLL